MGRIVFWVPQDSVYLGVIERLEKEGVLPVGVFDRALENVLKKGVE
jgi:hypothetical protein